MKPTNTEIIEENYYYSGKVHNPTPKAQKVKTYYTTSAPVSQKVIEEIQVIEPKKQATFAPRTYTLEEGKPAKYELSRMELHPTEVIEEKVAEPVVFETRQYKKSPKDTIEVRITEDNGAYGMSPVQESETVVYE
mmetsp:Transcript_10629/g.39636  ORF Transcript_10629/g.39636 Transcript_10629/m.39636 type:complete len:135 (-) Transcript_10629:1072-1476(-)